jgi:PAS domain S-box-containing protein
MCEMLGYTEPELLQRTILDVTYGEDRADSSRALLHVATGAGGDYQADHRYLRANGQIMWALIAVSAVRDADGETLYFVTQVQDITERRRA